MTLMKTATLASYLGVDDCTELVPACEAAEAALRAWLDTETLEEQTRTEIIKVQVGRRALPTTYWPVTGLTSLTGTEHTYSADKQEFGTWTVAHRDGFTAQDDVTAVYTTGWASWDALPNSLQVALKELGKFFHEDGGRITLNEKIGDWSATFQQLAGTESFPPMISTLLQRWRAPS